MNTKITTWEHAIATHAGYHQSHMIFAVGLVMAERVEGFRVTVGKGRRCYLGGVSIGGAKIPSMTFDGFSQEGHSAIKKLASSRFSTGRWSRHTKHMRKIYSIKIFRLTMEDLLKVCEVELEDVLRLLSAPYASLLSEIMSGEMDDVSSGPFIVNGARVM